jgi:hypothetical protein
MNKEHSFMIEHRTQALTTVFLTGRNNIEVINLPNLGELDMLCRIVSPGEEYEMLFGVIGKGTSEVLVSARLAETYLNSRLRGLKAVKTYPFPVLVIIFSMQSDDGYYSWKIEPTVSDSAPGLILNDRFSCERATKTGLDSIIEKVRAWYSAYYEQVFLVRS